MIANSAGSPRPRRDLAPARSEPRRSTRPPSGAGAPRRAAAARSRRLAAHRSPPRASQSRAAPSSGQHVPRTTPSASAPPPRREGRDDHRHADAAAVRRSSGAGGGGVDAAHAAGRSGRRLCRPPRDESMITRQGRSASTVSSVARTATRRRRLGGSDITIARARISRASSTIRRPGLPGAHLLPVAGHAPAAAARAPSRSSTPRGASCSGMRGVDRRVRRAR